MNIRFAMATILMVLTISPATGSTCVGADPCHACHTCEYCKRCSKMGGTCGVCNLSASEMLLGYAYLVGCDA